MRDLGIDTMMGKAEDLHMAVTATGGNDMNGTIIHGTLRPEDLIPALIEALDERKDECSLMPEYRNPKSIAHYSAIDDVLGSLERAIVKPGFYDSEEAGYALEMLFDCLDAYAPEGHYFGAHPGDGSDFGYWAIEDDESATA